MDFALPIRSLTCSVIFGHIRAVSFALSVPSTPRLQLTLGSRRRYRKFKLEKFSAVGTSVHQSLVDFANGMSVQQTSLLGALLIDYAIQLVGWGLASLLQTDKTYDGFGSLTFFTLSLASLLYGGMLTVRHVLMSAAVCIWAARLGTFLLVRVFKTGGDSRLEYYRTRPAAFLVLWLIQGVWVFVTISPLLLLNSSAVNPGLQASDVIGGALWLLGFVLEAVADQQKYAFKMKPENKGRFINTGLWRCSRYPNYFGEMLLWWGVWVVCSGAFDSIWNYLSLTSPLLVMLLLTQVSGIPMQEKQASQRWGGDSTFQEYRRTTPLIVPWPKW